MLWLPPDVSMNSWTKTILLQTPGKVLQTLLSNAMQEAEHGQTHRHALVSEVAVSFVTLVFSVACYCGHC